MTPLANVHALPWRSGLSYGLLGLPLAFAALPLYVVLPHHYARSFGLPLATVGVLLMAVRLVDAVVEPWLGRASDALFARSARAVLLAGAVAATVQWLGMAGLFFPAVDGQGALGAWLVGGLLVTCMAHSLLVIAHQAWGVRLGGDDLLRGRIVAWREGLGLAGVIAASALSVVWGPTAMLAVLGGTLLLGWLTWWRAPRPVPQPPTAALPLWEPLAQPAFRRLLAVFMCNGIASALADNVAMASGPMVWVHADRFADGEDTQSIFPWRLWQLKSDPSQGVNPGIGFFQPPMNADVNLRSSKTSIVPGDIVWGGVNAQGQSKFSPAYQVPFERAIEELAFFSKEVRILGCYRAHAFRIETQKKAAEQAE
jgi:hypothetical protein